MCVLTCIYLLPNAYCSACACPVAKQTDAAYQEVKDVRTASRGLGAWGDMVIELKNGDKLELRSLQK